MSTPWNHHQEPIPLLTVSPIVSSYPSTAKNHLASLLCHHELPCTALFVVAHHHTAIIDCTMSSSWPPSPLHQSHAIASPQPRTQHNRDNHLACNTTVSPRFTTANQPLLNLTNHPNFTSPEPHLRPDLSAMLTGGKSKQGIVLEEIDGNRWWWWWWW